MSNNFLNCPGPSTATVSLNPCLCHHGRICYHAKPSFYSYLRQIYHWEAVISTPLNSRGSDSVRIFLDQVLDIKCLGHLALSTLRSTYKVAFTLPLHITFILLLQLSIAKICPREDSRVHHNTMGSLSKPDIPKPWTKTPLIESAALSRAAGW